MVHLNGRARPEATYSPDTTSSLPSNLYDDLQSLNHRQDRSAAPRRSSSNLPTRGPKPLLPRSLKEALQLAELLSKSKLIPKGFETAETCLVGILYGMEVGLSPIAALQRMAVIDGRPTIWGDAALALVQASGLLQSIQEEIVERDDSDNRKILTAICKVKREGRSEPTVGSFSIEDAKRAGLWQKPGPWTDYPKRMLTMRARAFALRDAFPDVLAGLYIREEFEGAEKRYDRKSLGSGRSELAEGSAPDDAEWERAQVLNQKESSKAANAASEIENGKTRNSASTSIRRAPPPPEHPTKLRDSSTEIIRHDEVCDEENGLAQSDDRKHRSDHLDPETLLDLYDSALCCALDLPTLDEIIDEFAERFSSQSSEIQLRAQKIIENHRKRVEDLDQSFGSKTIQGPNDEIRSTELDPVHDGADDLNKVKTDLPRGLKALLPNLGLGSMRSFNRRRTSSNRPSRSLASWNALKRLQNPQFANMGETDQDQFDDEEAQP